MSAFRGRAGPEQYVKAQAIDPEPLGSLVDAFGGKAGSLARESAQRARGPARMTARTLRAVASIA